MAGKKRRHPKEKNTAFKGLVHQLRELGLLKQGKIVYQPNVGKKLSAVLLDFVSPFQEKDMTDEAYRKLMALAVIAWNATILPEVEGKKLVETSVQSIVDSAGEEWRSGAEFAIAMLIEHKKRKYADDQRFIVEYRLAETENGYHLAVATLMKEEK